MTLQPPPPSRYPGADAYERNLQRIRLRQDTEGNWLKNDPVLASGEMGYTIGGQDAGSVLKVGDGTRRWSELPYLAAQGNSGPSGAPGADGHSVTVYGPSDSPPSPVNTQLECGDIWLSNGLYAKNPSFDAALITPGAKGDPGDAATIDAVSAVALPNGTPPTVNNVGDSHHAQFVFGLPAGDQGIQGIQGVQGPPGPQGPAGDTFKISGAVANAAALDPAPPNLSVFITQDNSHLHIYDPASGAAGANGYVDLGAIAGPQGASTYFSAPVAKASDLPAVGAAGQTIMSLDDGHMHSWNVTSGTWIDAGQIRGPSGAGISDGSADGQVPVWSVTFHSWTPTLLTFNTITDVDVSQQEDGSALEDADILHYDLASQTWKAIGIRDYLEAEVNLANIGDCTISGGSTPTDGQVLTWDQANLTWKNMSLPPSGITNWSDKDWKAGEVVYAHSPIGNDHRLRLFRARQDIATGSLSPMQGQPQVDVVTLNAPTQSGLIYTVGTGGSVTSYTTKSGDTVTTVRDALVDLINGHGYMGHAHAFPEGTDAFRLLGETHDPFTTFLPPDNTHGFFVTGSVSTRQNSTSSFWEDISPQWHIDDLEGVDIQHVPPTDGQILVWAAARAEFEAGDFTVEALSNTEITSPQDGQSLVYNGTTGKWVNAAVTSPIVYMGTGAWVSADVADPAKRYGMAADTAPSPADYPPLAGDQYIDLTTGTVTVFTGTSGGTRPTNRRISEITGGASPVDAVPTTLSELSDVANTAPTMNQMLLYNATTHLWTPADMPATNPNNFYTKSETYSKTEVDAKFTGFHVNFIRSSPTANPLYAEAPAGKSAAGYAEVEGFAQHEGDNFTCQPYVYFDDGHECNFAVTTNKSHAFHFVQYDGGGTRDTNDTFVTNHGCRWTFKSVSDYDVKLGRPIFFTFKAFRIDEYWEFTWHGTYMSSNGTPMIFDGGIEYFHNHNITRMGVSLFGWSTDNALTAKGRIIFEGE